MAAVKLYINTTSPFVRLVRIAIAEKRLTDDIATEVVNPWADPHPFLDDNPAGRVPTLVTGNGVAISETFLILRWLDALVPAPSIWPAEDLERTLAVAAPALGATEAATAIIIGRKSSAGFDSDSVGSKRFRTMANGLSRLNANLPRDFADRPDIANMAAATALDYILLRFADRDWLADLPALRDWRRRQADRPSLISTMPHV